MWKACPPVLDELYERSDLQWHLWFSWHSSANAQCKCWGNPLNIKARPRQQLTGGSLPVQVAQLWEVCPMKYLCCLYPFMFWNISEWKSWVSDNYWFGELSCKWKPSFRVSLCQVLMQPPPCKCAAWCSPKISLAHADEPCKSGCLFAGRVWASAPEGTVKENMKNSMRRVRARHLVFGPGCAWVRFKSGIIPACPCREKAGFWSHIPFLLIVTFELGALLSVKWSRRGEKGRKIPLDPWWCCPTRTAHCWADLGEAGLLFKAWPALDAAWAWLPSLPAPSASPWVLPPLLRAVVGGLFLAWPQSLRVANSPAGKGKVNLENLPVEIENHQVHKLVFQIVSWTSGIVLFWKDYGIAPILKNSLMLMVNKSPIRTLTAKKRHCRKEVPVVAVSDLASPSGAEGRKMIEDGEGEEGEERCVVCLEAAKSIRDIFRSNQLDPSSCEGKQGRKCVTCRCSFLAALWQIPISSCSRDNSAPDDLPGEPQGWAAESGLQSGHHPQLPWAGCCNPPWDYPSVALTPLPSRCVADRCCSSWPWHWFPKIQ